MRHARAVAFFVISLAAAACNGGKSPGAPTPTPTPPPPPPGVVPLSPVEHLVRASMALKGTRPSIAEIQAVEADPNALGSIVDGYLATPEFGETIRDLHNQVMLSRSEANGQTFPVVGVATNYGWTVSQISHSVSEEPLKLIEYVVTHDRPYTEIVTADYTVADQIVATVWDGLDSPSAAPGDWQVSHWTDGRPAAGILASSSLFERHNSNGSNYHRGRANFVSSALLCDDFLDRDVVIDTNVDLSDPDAVANAVIENPACASCHQTLDPLASFFMGFQGNIVTGNITSYPIQNWYRVNREKAWMNTNKRAPGYFGIPGDRLDDLGQMIAADPRFSLCTAEHFYTWLTQTDPASVDLGTESYFQQVLITSGFDAKALAKAVVLSDGFKAAKAEDGGNADAVVGMLKARPEQLARTFRDLTGFTWETDLTVKVKGSLWGRVELPTTDLTGYRVLGGGIDSYFVTAPTNTVNTTSSLFLRAFAAQAAGYVVDADFALPVPSSRKLLTAVSQGETGEAAIRAQLAALHLRLYGEDVSPTSPEIDDDWALWSSTQTRTDATHAWKTTLTALLQDIRIAYY